MNFFNIGPLELIVIMMVVLIVFGPGKLPEMGRALGQAIREFRQMSSEVNKQLSEGMDMLETENKEKQKEATQPPPEKAANTEPAKENAPSQ